MRNLLFLLLLVLTAFAAAAQTSEADRILEVRRAELNLRQAKMSADRQKALAQQGLAAQTDVDRAQAEYDRADIDLQRARLALVNELPSFRIVSAVKSMAGGNRSRVTLTLEPLSRSQAAGVAQSYLVSIKGGDTIIGDPYQQEVSVSPGRHRVSVSFSLLREADEVTVLILSGARREELPILLQRAAAGGAVRVTCGNYSQEAAVGGKLEYPLTVERFGTGIRSVGIRVAGLPAGFIASSLDAESKAVMTGFRFGDTENEKKLLLAVFLPQQAEQAWLDRVIAFRAEVLSEDGSPAGGVDLQLHPRAAPKLLLTATNLLIDVGPSGRVSLPLGVENIGSTEAADVLFDVSAPLGVSVDFDPPLVRHVGPRQRVEARMHVAAEPDAVPGDYTLKVKLRTQSRLLTIESPEQTFRVDIHTAAGAAWIIPASAAVLGGVGGIALLLRRRTR